MLQGKKYMKVVINKRLVVFLCLLGICANVFSESGIVGNWRFDDGSEATAKDYSGNGNNGTITNASSTTGKVGKALSFDSTDGDNDYVAIPNNSAFNLSTAITVEAWVNPNTVSSTQVIAGKTYGTSWEMGLSSSQLYVNAVEGGTTYSGVVKGGTVSTGLWNHVVWTYDSSTGVNIAYVNGVQVATSTKSGVLGIDSTTLYIGRRCYGNLLFNGLIDEVAIYNRILSADEVYSHYKNSYLAGSWSMDEGDSSTVADLINDNDGTVTDAVWINGKLGAALDFDGDGDMVTIPDDSALDISDQITVEAWINPDAVSGNQTIAGKCYTTSWELSLYNNNLNVNACEGGTYYARLLSSGGGVEAGKWNHVAWTYDSTTGENISYVNGVARQISALGGDVGTDSTNLFIGCRYYGNLGFCGGIDEVKIHKKALSANEIFNRYNNYGLVGAWNFDEGTDSTVADCSGNGIDGTISGALWVSGKLDMGLSFDGEDDYVTIPHDDSLNITDEITVEAWIYPNEVEENYVIVGKHTSTSWELGISGGSVCLNVIEGGVQYNRLIGGEAEVTQDAWNHVVWTYNSSTGINKVYVNGVEGQSVTTSGLLGTDDAPIYVGRRYYNTLNFDGLIDEVKIYKRALSATEVMDNMECGYNLRTRLNLNEGYGTTAFDTSKYGNHATAVNIASSDWVTGHINLDGYFKTALSFADSDDYLTIPNSSSLQIIDDLTISLWVNPTTVNNESCVLVDKDFGGEFSLVLEMDGSVSLYQGTSQSSGSYFCATAIPSGGIVNDEWQHIIVTREMDTRNIKGYVNGTLVNTVEYPEDSAYSPPVATTSPVKIAAGFTNDFNGVIDDVRIYAEALTQDQIDTIGYNLLWVHRNMSYYTTEATAISMCEINIPESELDDCYLVAKDSSGNVLGTNITPEDDTDLDIDISSLSIDTHTITIELRRDTGDLAFSRDLVIKKLAENPGHEVKVDYQNGIVYKNGEKFFPIGFYILSSSYDDTDDIEEIANDTDFNTIMRVLFHQTSSEALTLLTNAAAIPESGSSNTLSLNVMHRHENHYAEGEQLINYKNELTDAEFYAAFINNGHYASFIDAVEEVYNEPNLLCYYSFDEAHPCEITSGTYLYDNVNLTDGYHPSFTIFQSVVFDVENMTSWMDILGLNTYLVSQIGSTNYNQTVKGAIRRMYIAKKRAEKDYKAFWSVYLGEHFSGTIRRPLYPKEQRSQTYGALISGAKGMFYYHAPIKHELMWQELIDLSSEMTILTPYLLSSEPEQTITYSAGNYDPINEEFVPVIAKLFKASSSDDYVLLLCNTEPYSVDVNVSCSLLSSSTVSSLFDSGVTYDISADQLAGYDTRAYYFTSTSTDPIQISVSTTIRTDLAPIYDIEDDAYTIAGRTTCTNMAPNPDLEAASLLSWPNYTIPMGIPYPRIGNASQGWGLVTNPDKTGLCDVIGSSGDDPGDTCLYINSNEVKTGVYIKFIPETAGDYTISAYVKVVDTDPNETETISVRMGYLGGTPASVGVSVDDQAWTRVTHQCNIPDGGEYAYAFIYIESGAVYIDAVQIEQTTTSSPIPFTKE